MTRHAPLSLTCAALLLAACAGPEPQAVSSEPPAWADFRTDPAPAEWDDVQILSVATRESIGGPEAVVEVAYRTACEASTYAVFWSPVATRSLPPQTSFTLRRDGKGGDCPTPGRAQVAFPIEEPAEDLGAFIGHVHGGGDAKNAASFRWPAAE
ncbi:hypothetical protein P2H44_00670 [Albimonas sp. CAU 1670]|uniref:hypothetical protein n=1 Tax=Albimonas sp. CAU 1670 TaxID=3032599 RepID=UPI0023D9BB99|nr:hypothetical protein [Albimonas sp. CAU 1670]MDF2231057.1 hypothetical protein [Albimonas sp. CAU 1670]